MLRLNEKILFISKGFQGKYYIYEIEIIAINNKSEFPVTIKFLTGKQKGKITSVYFEKLINELDYIASPDHLHIDSESSEDSDYENEKWHLEN